MKSQTRLGAVLIIIGVLVFVYQGIILIRHGPVAERPAPEVTDEKSDAFPVTQAIGALATAGGIFLVVLGSRKS